MDELTQATQGAPRKTTVFYVEDEPVNVMLMQVFFQQRPALRLEVAGSGEEAEAMAGTLQPALLLLDMRLPDCRGTELLPRLRRRPGWQDVPAVAVTAETAFHAEGTGFLEVWRKPVRLQQMLERLDGLLGGAAQHVRAT